MKIPERLKYIIRCTMSFVLAPVYKKKRDAIFDKCKDQGIKNIPIYIISYNRLSYLKQFIEQMEKSGLKNLHIIDNGSTYPPLLEYYKKLSYDVIYMGYNGGHMVFWEDDRFKACRENLYVVSDPDLELAKECPGDFLEFFFSKLKKYPFVRKVGFSLVIDDLPDDGCVSKDALEWEKQYYKTKIKKDNIYYAGIDTTFALYVPDQFVKGQKFLSAFRSGKPYQMRHLPWYKNVDDVTEEDVFYSNHKKNGWSDPVKGFKPDEEKEKD